jgi:hypothetical protein
MMKKIFLFAVIISLCACHKTTPGDTNKIDVAKTIIGKWLVTGKVIAYYTAGNKVAESNVAISSNAPSNSTTTLIPPYYYQFDVTGSMGIYGYDSKTTKYILDPNVSGYTLTNENKTLNAFNGQVDFLHFDLSLTDNNSMTLVYTIKLVSYLAPDNTVKTADYATETATYTRMQ